MKAREPSRHEEPDYGRKIATKIRRAMLAIDRIAERTLQSRLNLTPSQHWVLVNLQGHEGVSQKAICRLMGLSPAAISRTIDALSDKGFIRREENPSCRREHVLTLTADGRREATEATAVLREEFDRVFGAMSPDEKTVLDGSLESLLDALRSHQ